MRFWQEGPAGFDQRELFGVAADGEDLEARAVELGEGVDGRLWADRLKAVMELDE